MIAPARASRLSLVAHAVDATGALCGARPQGRWRLTARLPVNCPRCLLRLAQPRWALCESPAAWANAPVHVRQVGHEGVSLSGNAAGAKTLCGLLVGWDLRELETLETVRGLSHVCAVCARVALAPHLAPTRDLPPANAVR